MIAHAAELYRFRALIWTLVLRELRARYRGSLLGFLWSFLNPLLLMLVYVLVFSVYLRVPMHGYAVFLFFLSPILYPVSTVPPTLALGSLLVLPLRPLYFLNPVAGLVQSYQNIFYYGREPHWIHLGMATLSAILAVLGGYWVFDRLR